MPFTPPPIETDLDVITQRIFDGIATAIPGWEPVEGSLDTVLAEEIGRETVTTNNNAVTAISLGVAALGESAFGLAARIATPAQIEVDVTVTLAGDVIPAGLTVVGTSDVGVEVAFELLEAVVSTGTVEPVTMFALVEGEVGNNVPPGALTVATGSATVVSATATASSFGGMEDEALADYLSRLVDFLSITRQGIVRASDLELYARNYPGVSRALAVDLYDADTDTDGVERTATVFVVAADGGEVPSLVRDDLLASIELLREVNFVAYVENATYTPVTVEFTAVSEPTYDPALVEAEAIAAVASFLDPITWGSTTSDPRAFNRIPAVGYLSVVAVLSNVPGIASLTSVTLDGLEVDAPLAGKAPIPTATIIGTVS